jgi:preprotein translocase subunit SecF
MVREEIMFDIVSKRYWLFIISGILIVISIISLATPFGRLKLSTEFSSGSRLRINFEQTVSQPELQQELTKLGYPGAKIQTEINTASGQGDFLIRTLVLTDDAKNALVTGLQKKFGNLTVKEFSNVSAEVATQTLRTVGIAVVVAAVCMLLYIAWAFRRMPHPFRYGFTAIIALLHDVLVAVGIFSIIGGILKWEVDLMFVTGVLTVIGFSINNTIIIFDRIRENTMMGTSSRFEVIVNDSLLETMGRTLNTSLVVLFAVVALMLFVGASIQNFAIILLVGVIAGTFDSICIAPLLLVVWEKGEWGRFIGRKSVAKA